MTRLLRTSLAFVVVFASVSHAYGGAKQRVKKRVQETSITGTYKYGLNTLEVLGLPDHQARIMFNGFWPNDNKRVESRNVGSFDETVPIKGRTAVIKPKYGDDDCSITLEFSTSRVVVTQGGYRCGFGFNVEADGTYRKVSGKPPVLPPKESE